MKLVVIAMVAFTAGYFVGKPTEIVLQVPESKECTKVILDREGTTTTPPQGKISENKTDADGCWDDNEKQVPCELSEDRDDREERENDDRASDPYYKTASMSDEEAGKWIEQQIDRNTQLISIFSGQGPVKTMLTPRELEQLDKLRPALETAGMRIVEERESVLGRFVYEIHVGQK